MQQFNSPIKKLELATSKTFLSSGNIMENSVLGPTYKTMLQKEKTQVFQEQKQKKTYDAVVDFNTLSPYEKAQKMSKGEMLQQADTTFHMTNIDEFMAGDASTIGGTVMTMETIATLVDSKVNTAISASMDVFNKRAEAAEERNKEIEAKYAADTEKNKTEFEKQRKEDKEANEKLMTEAKKDFEKVNTDIAATLKTKDDQHAQIVKLLTE